MPWFADYCKEAARTDRLSDNPDHVDLLAAGLFGETGSVLAELKKTVRERGAYPSYQNRLTEEIGDLLWYFARLVTVLAPSDIEKLEELADCAGQRDDTDNEPIRTAFTLGSTAGALLATLRQNTDGVMASQLRTIWRALLRVAAGAHIDLHEAATKNIQKTQSRWPSEARFVPLFDEWFNETEQIPRKLAVEFRQIRRDDKCTVLLRCKGLNIGDRLTDNIDQPDFYRFHDVFHLAHAVYLGWSPVVRVLLNCKRKSDPQVDENQDGARARIIEEAVSAVVFSRAKKTRFYDGIDHVDYDLLKTVREFVHGFEVEEVPLWQWERAIMNGYRVFRALRDNGGGTVTADLINRDLRYAKPSPIWTTGDAVDSLLGSGG